MTSLPVTVCDISCRPFGLSILLLIDCLCDFQVLGTTKKKQFFDFAEKEKGNSSRSYLTASRGSLFIMQPCKTPFVLGALFIASDKMQVVGKNLNTGSLANTDKTV